MARLCVSSAGAYVFVSITPRDRGKVLGLLDAIGATIADMPRGWVADSVYTEAGKVYLVAMDTLQVDHCENFTPCHIFVCSL